MTAQSSFRSLLIETRISSTLNNLLAQAVHPERLKFGICLQLDASDPMSWGEQSFPDHAHLKVKHVAAADSRGACWARSQAQGFYNSADLLLQIDSHMRAVQHWNDLLLQTWRECNDTEAVLIGIPMASSNHANCSPALCP